MPGADRLAEHYIRAYGLCAVYVAASGDAGAPGIVGTTRSPRAREHRLRHDHGRRAGILRLWWCATEADARAVAEAARAAGGAGADDIPAVAAALGVALADPGTVADRAREAVEAVRARIEAMRATGGLRAVNADYKLMRQRRAAAGQATMPYPVYLRRRAIGMLYDMASEVRARAGRR